MGRIRFHRDRRMNWKNTDPRDDINKRDDIVILRPDERGAMSRAGTAHVDSKETYNIFTSFDDYKCIAADGKWDELWWWTRAPRCNPCTTIDLDDEASLQNKIDEYDSLITSIRNALTSAGIPDHEEYPDEEVDAREKSLRTGGRMIPLIKRVQMLADRKVQE